MHYIGPSTVQVKPSTPIMSLWHYDYRTGPRIHCGRGLWKSCCPISSRSTGHDIPIHQHYLILVLRYRSRSVVCVRVIRRKRDVRSIYVHCTHSQRLWAANRAWADATATKTLNKTGKPQQDEGHGRPYGRTTEMVKKLPVLFSPTAVGMLRRPWVIKNPR